jgi:hypothetical protein
MKTGLLRYALFVVCATWSFDQMLLGTPVNVESHIAVIAQSGQQAPGAPAGTVFSRFSRPVINNVGQSAFGAVVQQSGSTQTVTNLPPGIWSTGAGELALVAYHATYPSEIDFVSDNSLNLVFDDHGETVFHGPGLWADRHGLLEPVVVPGTSVTVDGQSRTFSRVSRPIVNQHGVISFVGAHSSGNGIYVGRDGRFNLIADNRTPQPGTTHIPHINLLFPASINSSGQVAFAGAANSSRNSVWTDVRGHLELIADDSPNNVLSEFGFKELGSPTITDSGKVVFHGKLTGNAITDLNDEVLMKFDGAGLVALVREGDPAPGLPQGNVFATFPSLAPGSGFTYYPSLEPVFDRQGNMAFRAALRGPDISSRLNSSIWRVRNDLPELVVRTGDEAPGVEPGIVFFSFQELQVNHNGQLAFVAHISGPGVYSTNDYGIWAQGAGGRLHLIAREGDFIDMSDGARTDVRQITDIRNRHAHFADVWQNSRHAFRGERDQLSSFNSRGQLAFNVVFHDQSQAILISNLLAIPEPVTLTLAWLEAAWLALIRRRC